MTIEMWLIALVRVAGSLPVLRWPFYGALLAMLADQCDLFMMNLLDLGGVNNYQAFDKYLDQVYLAAFLVVAMRWQGPERAIAVGLYMYRLVGFLAFEVMQERDVLLFFPNLFEYWFVFVAGLKHFRYEPFRSSEEASRDGQSLSGSGGIRVLARPVVSRQVLIVSVTGLVALKLFQEYALHYGRWLDGFTAVEAVEAIWRFLLPPY